MDPMGTFAINQPATSRRPLRDVTNWRHAREAAKNTDCSSEADGKENIKPPHGMYPILIPISIHTTSPSPYPSTRYHSSLLVTELQLLTYLQSTWCTCPLPSPATAEPVGQQTPPSNRTLIISLIPSSIRLADLTYSVHAPGGLDWIHYLLPSKPRSPLQSLRRHSSVQPCSWKRTGCFGPHHSPSLSLAAGSLDRPAHDASGKILHLERCRAV